MEDDANLKKAFVVDVMGVSIHTAVLVTVGEDDDYIYVWPKTTLGKEKFGEIASKLYDFNGEYLHDEKGTGYFRFKKKF